MTKPFDLREVVARVKALCRRLEKNAAAYSLKARVSKRKASRSCLGDGLRKVGGTRTVGIHIGMKSAAGSINCSSHSPFSSSTSLWEAPQTNSKYSPRKHQRVQAASA